MSDNVVTFNIRCEKSLIELKIETPSHVSEFIDKLVTKYIIDAFIKNCIINQD